MDSLAFHSLAPGREADGRFKGLLQTSVHTQRKREDLLKISDLAREAGVPVGTIKFYLRAGLLPPPTLKTGRNMAYYDRSFVDRIRVIKELQQKRYLPLDVIKELLDHADNEIGPHEVATLLRLEEIFDTARGAETADQSLTRADIAERYDAQPEDIQFCIDLGVLTPIIRDGEERFEGDDIRMLDTLRSFDNIGLGKEIVSSRTALPVYVEAVDRLVREELKLFAQGVTGTYGPGKIDEIALGSVKIGEQFVGLLRRKRLRRAVQDLRLESEVHEGTTATG